MSLQQEISHCPSCHQEGTGGASPGCPCKPGISLAKKHQGLSQSTRGPSTLPKQRGSPLLVETPKLLNCISFPAFSTLHQMKKPIPPLVIGLLLSSCGGHSNKSVPDSVKTGAKGVAVSPVLLFGGSMIGGKKIAQKSAIATKASPKWFAEEVSGERLRSLMTPTGKLIGKWHYMGSRGEHHFFPMKFGGGISIGS